MSFKRALGPFDATMVVIGGIIGTGIFKNPAIVARAVNSSPMVLAAWAAGGLIAMAGAFAYAELGQQQPKAGGPYVYLRDAWHPAVGFLYGWALLLMIETGAMAAVALVFGDYALKLVGASNSAAAPVAIAAIALLTFINYIGVTPGSRVLNTFVVLKLAALGVLIAFAWWGRAASPEWMVEHRVGAPSGPLAFGAALIPIMFAYGGWQQANYVAEEMRDPERHLPRSLIFGTLAVVVIYLLVNVAYLRTLGLPGLAATETPAADVAALWLGPNGSRFMSAIIAVSAFGFLDLSILAPPRVYYAMAVDRTFIPALAKLHPRFQTPGLAIVLQSAWAVVLLLTGSDETLVNTVTFADWIFFALTVGGLFVLRRRFGKRGGFKVPGYPFVPAAFVVASLIVVFSVVRTDPVRAAIGAALLLTGIPVYYWFSRSQRAAGAPAPSDR